MFESVEINKKTEDDGAADAEEVAQDVRFEHHEAGSEAEDGTEDAYEYRDHQSEGPEISRDVLLGQIVLQESVLINCVVLDY